MPQFGTQNIQSPINPMMGTEDLTSFPIPGSSSIPLTSQSRKQDLERKFEDIKNLDRNVRSKKIINKNRLAEEKSKVIQSIFQMMQNLGVDPGDLESINQFLQSLDQQDPDLRELFESAFNALTKESDSEYFSNEPESPENGSEGLMGKYNNLAQSIMQPR